MKVKTKNQTYEITDIRENTSKIFIAYYNDFYISIEKEPKKDKLYYVMCSAPSGSYIYDGYFHGTKVDAIKDVFDNIELEIDESFCPKCNIQMECEDFYYDVAGKRYIDIWICPKCKYRKDMPENEVLL